MHGLCFGLMIGYRTLCCVSVCAESMLVAEFCGYDLQKKCLSRLGLRFKKIAL